MAITDLTGTTWHFNDVLSLPSSASSNVYYSINYTATLYGTEMDFASLEYNASYLTFVGNTLEVPYSSDNGWISAYPDRLIRITGGTDVTNSSLISWLESNATQVVREISKIKLPDGSEYNFKDTVSGYITSAPVTSVNGQTGNVTVQGVLTAGTGITIANNVISLNVTVVNNEYGGQTITIGG